MTLAVLIAAVVVGTWNGNWFPSGRAEHRANPEVEAATSSAAAKMLRGGLDAINPAGTNDVILCLHEIRGPRAATNLVAQIGRKGLRVVSISGYRRRDRFDMQQDVIATTLPVAESHWSAWKQHGKETPPRGYAYAAVVVGPAVTAGVYSVHLKSNYGAKTPEDKAMNRVKRAHAVDQMIKQEKPKRGKPASAVIVAGDFNADKWRKEFAEEKIFTSFENAGFLNPLERLPSAERGTHPNRRYGDSALDYVMVRGFEPQGLPRIVPNDAISDHFALFTVLTSK